MRKHNVAVPKYVLAFSLTVIIFLFGVLLGNYFTAKKFEQVTDFEDNLQIQTQGAEVQYLLLVQQPCSYINDTPLTDELYQISERVNYMEAQRGENDQDVLRLKGTYSLLELRHWLLTLRTNEQCKTNLVPILYFYNNANNCDSCKEQGYTLTYLRKKYPDLRIYSFDIRTQNPALDTIKRMHGLSENDTPVLVLPDRVMGFTSIDDLDTVFRQYNMTADPDYS